MDNLFGKLLSKNVSPENSYTIRIQAHTEGSSVVECWNPLLILHILGCDFPHGDMIEEHVSQDFSILQEFSLGPFRQAINRIIRRSKDSEGT